MSHFSSVRLVITDTPEIRKILVEEMKEQGYIEMDETQIDALLLDENMTFNSLGEFGVMAISGNIALEGFMKNPENSLIPIIIKSVKCVESCAATLIISEDDGSNTSYVYSGRIFYKAASTEYKRAEIIGDDIKLIERPVYLRRDEIKLLLGIDPKGNEIFMGIRKKLKEISKD